MQVNGPILAVPVGALASFPSSGGTVMRITTVGFYVAKTSIIITKVERKLCTAMHLSIAKNAIKFSSSCDFLQKAVMDECPNIPFARYCGSPRVNRVVTHPPAGPVFYNVLYLF